MTAGTRRTAVAALAFYLLWTLATWLLEGRIRTLLRPDAVTDRVVYVAVANVLIGIVGAAVVVRFVIASGVDRADTGFGVRTPSPVWIAIAIILGLALYVVQGAPSTDPVVIGNAFSQVLAVSVAEVLVCWALVGSVTRQALAGSRWVSTVGAAVVASALFGLYHFGHSPPFDSPGMVAFLGIIGLVTSAFFFVARDVYATIVFHNFLGVYGVVQALAAADRLPSLETPQLPLLVTAAIVLLVLIAADALIIRRAGPARMDVKQ